MESLVVVLEFGCYGPRAMPAVGELWRASFYDRKREQLFAGSADDPFEAVGWALFERELRSSNGNQPVTTKPNVKPFRALALLRAKLREQVTAPMTKAAGLSPTDSPVVFEQGPSASSVPPIYASDAESGGFAQHKTAAARRARTKKKG